LLPGFVLLPWYRTLAGIVYAPIAICLWQPIAFNAMVSALLGRGTVWKGAPRLMDGRSRGVIEP